MKRRLLVVIAVAVFLLFLGTNGYEALCPPYYWYVECVLRDGAGKTEFWRKSGELDEQDQVESFVEWAEKRGEACAVIPVRECPWDDLHFSVANR